MNIARQNKIFDAIHLERMNQETLKHAGAFRFTCADEEMGDTPKGLVLFEEAGEVARAVLNLTGLAYDDENKGDLRNELIQTAAVCVAWLECLDARAEPPQK